MRDDVNTQWVIAAHPVGKPKPSDFELREVDLPIAGDGQVLLKTLYLGLAPVMRMYMQGESVAGEPALRIGDVIHGRGVAEVIQSNHPDYAIGDIVHGQMGWQSYKASSMSPREKFYRCADMGVSYAHYTATLAMTGLSAWAGFTDCGRPKACEVVVVSGAAGGVGSIVVQIARIMGCHVIGIAGGKEKCAWLKTLGVHETIDYKSENISKRLADLCPNGLDIYFDNVGGEILEAALDHMAMGARIILCGSISEYTRSEKRGPANYTNLRRVNGSMTGFFVYNYLDQLQDSVAALGGWLRDGHMRPTLDVADGILQMPQALMKLYDGGNYGVQCCRVRRGPYDDA